MSMGSSLRDGDNVVVDELGAGSSMQQLVPVATPDDGEEGVWIVSSTRGVPSRSGRRPPSRKSGTRRTRHMKACGAGIGQGRRRLKMRSIGRLRPDNDSCRRWVHRNEWEEFNSQPRRTQVLPALSGNQALLQKMEADEETSIVIRSRSRSRSRSSQAARH